MGESTKKSMGGLGSNFFKKFGAMNAIRSKSNQYMPEIEGYGRGRNVKPFYDDMDRAYDNMR